MTDAQLAGIVLALARRCDSAILFLGDAWSTKRDDAFAEGMNNLRELLVMLAALYYPLDRENTLQNVLMELCLADARPPAP